MKDIILIILYWLHSIAAVIWIGGIFFVLYAALPSAKEFLGKDAGKLMGVIGKRFTPFANYSIFILVFSGIFMAILKQGLPEVWATHPQWVTSILLKVFIVLAMVVIHIYRGLILLPRVGKMASELDKLDREAQAEASQRIAHLKRVSLNLVKVNLMFGMVVLLLSSIAIST